VWVVWLIMQVSIYGDGTGLYISLIGVSLMWYVPYEWGVTVYES